MTTIKCQVSVADGEVYLPSMRRLGILIHSVQQMGLLEDGHVVSVEGVIDLTSPDTARESYQALLSKLDLPEEWDAMPFDVYLFRDDVKDGMIGQGFYSRSNGASWEAFMEKEAQGMEVNYAELRALAEGEDPKEVSEANRARLEREEATL